jgi:hypothetical protein
MVSAHRNAPYVSVCWEREAAAGRSTSRGSSIGRLHWKKHVLFLFLESVVTRALLLSFVAAMCVGCASTDTVAPAFKAGDIAVARNFTHYPHLNGTHVLVTGDYEWRWIKGGNTLKCYAVKTVDGQELAAQTFQLQPLSAQASL